MSQNEGILNVLSREVMRAMFERVQSMGNSRMMSAFGAETTEYDDVEETLNVAYVNRAEVALAMDIFKPKASKGKELPVIVVVHGGGLFMGDRGMNRSYCRLLAHKGYLVFSLEYRLAPKATIGEQLDDVCAGMDRVGRMLVDYDVDFSRVFLVADSAGAYLGAYVTAMHESEKLQNIIGYKPSRMVFAAVGFISGMFYTNKMLEDQIFGDKRSNEKFRKYMNMEHPEIRNNLPPVFMATSCGDIFNNYSIKYHEVLKKSGRESKLVYVGDEDLQHIFPIMRPEHPKSLEVTDKMLAFFEEKAEQRRKRRTRSSETAKRVKELEKRIADGSINDQKVWSNLKERITADPSNLGKTAVIDCTREYTYKQMLEEWDRYAGAFTGLSIGADSSSRVALAGVITAEPLFALYALNMVGAEVSLFSYPDFLPGGMWHEMIEKEKITDIVISDIMVTPEVWEELKHLKNEGRLRNIILMHSKMGGPSVGPAEMVFNEYNYHMLKGKYGIVFMDELLEKYKDTEIKYDGSRGERIAFITHTSGTTKGTRKMLPFTDKIFNNTLNMIPKGHRTFISGPDDGKQLRTIQLLDMSSIMALSAQVHTVLANADTLVYTYFGFMHPKFIRAIDYYNISVLFITGFMVDKWINRPDIEDIDFSSLKVVGMAGGFITPEKMEEYRAFFRSHGYKYDITAGYGMSEAGGRVTFAPEGSKDDILGFADKDETEDLYIKDENDGKFYRLEDGTRTGLLNKYSDTRPKNELDGEIIFEYTTIDGKDYLCTNDLIRVNEDGSLSFAGRADKYFVNNEGRKFDSGIVDHNMSTQSAIDKCAVVPVMEKRIHDTVPVLYVVPKKMDEGAAERIREAFVDVYVKNRKIGADNLPTQFMIVRDIPLNANGKLDVYRITRERIGGDAYNLIPVFRDDELSDIRMEHVESVNSVTAGTLPQGMQNNSAYNFFDFMNADESDDSFDFSMLFKPWKMMEKLMPELGIGSKKFEMPEIPESVMKDILKLGNRLAGMPLGKKEIDVDFED